MPCEKDHRYFHCCLFIEGKLQMSTWCSSWKTDFQVVQSDSWVVHVENHLNVLLVVLIWWGSQGSPWLACWRWSSDSGRQPNAVGFFSCLWPYGEPSHGSWGAFRLVRFSVGALSLWYLGWVFLLSYLFFFFWKKKTTIEPRNFAFPSSF